MGMPIAISLGRRVVILVATLILLIGAILCATASSFESHLAARVMLGFAAGQSESVVPMIIQVSGGRTYLVPTKWIRKYISYTSDREAFSFSKWFRSLAVWFWSSVQALSQRGCPLNGGTDLQRYSPVFSWLYRYFCFQKPNSIGHKRPRLSLLKLTHRMMVRHQQQPKVPKRKYLLQNSYQGPGSQICDFGLAARSGIKAVA